MAETAVDVKMFIFLAPVLGEDRKQPFTIARRRNRLRREGSNSFPSLIIGNILSFNTLRKFCSESAYGNESVFWYL